jgi:Ni/Co efflux regulator RcnB
MKNTSAIISALLAVTQACWMLEPANAQPGHDKRDKPHKPQTHQGQQQQREDRQAGRDMPYREGRHPPSYNGPVQIGSYFQSHHREAAQEFYGRPENKGYCPPGLAKKGGSCLPPGQARKWQRGHPLPAGVVYYDVPRSVVLTLGVPPSGYRYVRVASDILLLAVGTNLVVDAIEDLVR